MERGAAPAPNARPGGPDWARMTPDERRAAIRRIIGDTVRGSMTHLGYADRATQDIVVEAALAQEEALLPVREAHRKLALALVMNPKSDQETAVLMANLRDAIKNAKSEREVIIKGLETRLEFSKKPGLSAWLSIMGITGDESAFMGGIAANFAGAMANMSRQLG